MYLAAIAHEKLHESLRSSSDSSRIICPSTFHPFVDLTLASMGYSTKATSKEPSSDGGHPLRAFDEFVGKSRSIGPYTGTKPRRIATRAHLESVIAENHLAQCYFASLAIYQPCQSLPALFRRVITYDTHVRSYRSPSNSWDAAAIACRGHGRRTSR